MVNKIIKNASWIIACKVAETLFMLTVTIFQARIFGPTNFGLITYAQSIVTVVVPIMQLGLNSILIKELVNNKNNEGSIMGTSLMMAMIAAPIAILFVLIFTSIVNAGSSETIIVCVLYSSLLLFQVFELLQYWFLAHYMSKYTAVTFFVAYVIASIYRLAILFINKSIYLFALSQALYYLIIAISLLYFYKKQGGQKFEFNKDIAKTLFNRSKYFLVSSLAVTFYTQIDRILLKNMCGDEVNGYYVAAITIVNMATFIFIAIIDSTQPDLIEKNNQNNELFEKGMTRLYSVVIYLALLMCIFLDIFAPLIIKLMYGLDYLPSINLLRIVTWYGLFSFIGIARSVYIVAKEQQKYIWIISILGALFSLMCNYILIKLFGASGAAVGAILVQIFVNVILGFIIKPIRRNNVLMFKALNPMVIKEMLSEFFH